MGAQAAMMHKPGLVAEAQQIALDVDHVRKEVVLVTKRDELHFDVNAAQQLGLAMLDAVRSIRELKADWDGHS